MAGILVLVVIVLIFFGAIAQSEMNKKRENEKRQEMTSALACVPEFIPTKKIEGIDSLYALAFDDDRQKMVLYLIGQTPTIINYKDIISVQLLEENQTISEKSTSRTIGGALVGGVLAGGAGAIVGGLSGASKHKNLHSSVKVKLLLRNSSNPSITIDCFNAITMTLEMKPVKDGGKEYYIYQKGLEDANRIVDLISVIIDAVDSAESQSYAHSTADELAKLAILKEKGILTEEEFAEQKRKLLNGDDKSNSISQLERQGQKLPE